MIARLTIRDFHVRIGSTKRAYDLVEHSLGKRLIELESEMQSELASLGELQRPSVNLDYERWQVQEELPQVFRAALFMQAYSQFERSIRNLADSAREEFGVSLNVNDLRGEGINQSVTFLERACGIPVPRDRQEWQNVTLLQKVRNLVTHRRGVLKPRPDADSETIRAFVKKHHFAMAIQGNEIRFSDEFVPFAIGQMETFLDQLKVALS